jgi:hypothetical protein
MVFTIGLITEAKNPKVQSSKTLLSGNVIKKLNRMKQTLSFKNVSYFN